METNDANLSTMERARPRWRIIAVVSLLALVAVAAAVVIAWKYGAASRDAEVEDGHRVLEQCRDDAELLELRATQLRAEAVALERRIRRLEARQQIAQATMSLVARNFGLAQARLEAASKSLRDGDVPELATRIEAIELVATNDPGAQRDELVALAQTLDELLLDKHYDAAPQPQAESQEERL